MSLLPAEGVFRDQVMDSLPFSPGEFLLPVHDCLKELALTLGLPGRAFHLYPRWPIVLYPDPSELVDHQPRGPGGGIGSCGTGEIDELAFGIVAIRVGDGEFVPGVRSRPIRQPV